MATFDKIFAKIEYLCLKDYHIFDIFSQLKRNNDNEYYLITVKTLAIRFEWFFMNNNINDFTFSNNELQNLRQLNISLQCCRKYFRHFKFGKVKQINN